MGVGWRLLSAEGQVSYRPLAVEVEVQTAERTVRALWLAERERVEKDMPGVRLWVLGYMMLGRWAGGGGGGGAVAKMPLHKLEDPSSDPQLHIKVGCGTVLYNLGWGWGEKSESWSVQLNW